VGRTAYSGRVKSILLSCKSKSVAKCLVDDLKEYTAGTTHDELKWIDVSVHACQLLNSFEKVVFFTPDELMYAADMVDKARGDGYEIVTIPDSIREKISGMKDATGKMILDLDQFKTEWNKSFEFKFIDEKDLTKQEREIFELTDKILDYVGGKPKQVKEIKISETMRLEAHSFQEANGLWDVGSGNIIIKRNQLKNLRNYAGTLLHEIAHAKSGASDITGAFEDQLTFLLGNVISKALDTK
jgi:hypothetical protein